MDLKKLLQIFEAPVGTGASGFPVQSGQAGKPTQKGGQVLPGDQFMRPQLRPEMSTGASGFPVQGSVAAGKPAISSNKPGQGAKPAADPFAAKVAAARKADAQQQAMTPRGDQTAGGKTNANFLPGAAGGAQPTQAAKPAEPAAASTAVDPSIGSGQNLAAKAAPSAGTNPFAMKVPDAPSDAGQAAKPSGVPSTLTITSPDSGQGAKPSTAPGLGAQSDAFQTPAPAAAYANPEGTGSGQAGMPSGDYQPVAGTTNVVSRTADKIAADNKAGPYAQYRPGNFEEDADEDLSELMRLSGQPIREKAVSKQQQKFMGMVHAMQKGKKIKGASPELKKVAKTMGKKDAKDFASTKHKGLPQKVDESVMLEAGNTLEHIVQRFKHETKNFLNGAELDDDLYNALYDYYVDNGEMPYGVAKAREGDPYQWVGDHFEDALSMMGFERQFQETVMPVMDDSLNELARLAGLSESQIDECGDMGMNQRDSMNVSTNMNSDGTKSVTISAQGEQAEALVQMLKLAGMSHMGHDSSSKEPVVMVSKDDEEMMEYANDPDEEYHSVDSIIHQGTDLHREKDMYPTGAKLGDNPMAEQIVDEELQSLLDSVLVREVDPQRPKGDTGIPDIFIAGKGIAPPSPDEGPVGKSKMSVVPPTSSTPKTSTQSAFNMRTGGATQAAPSAPAAPKAPSSPAIPRPGVKK